MGTDWWECHIKPKIFTQVLQKLWDCRSYGSVLHHYGVGATRSFALHGTWSLLYSTAVL